MKAVTMQHQERPFKFRAWDDGEVSFYETFEGGERDLFDMDNNYGWVNYTDEDWDFSKIVLENLPWKLDTGSGDLLSQFLQLRRDMKRRKDGHQRQLM